MLNLNAMDNEDPVIHNHLPQPVQEDVNAEQIINGHMIPNPQPIQIEADMIGAIKIKDALFIGDELAAQDLEFVVNNKVTHVIN